MQAFTILNASGSRIKMILVFFTSMVGVVTLIMYFIFKYSTKYKVDSHSMTKHGHLELNEEGV